MDDDTTSGGTTTAPHPPDDPSAAGPRVSAEEARDLTRLRRSATDRKVLGVCGGLARQLDVDPTLVRVVMAVLVLFAGAGLLLYLGGWLFVPDERTGRAVVHLEGGARSAALLVVGVLSVLTAIGQGWGGPLGVGGWWFLSPFPLLVLLAVGAVVWLTGRNRTEPTAAPDGSAHDAPPPGATRRLVPAYTPPARPKRSGPLLFWPTLAVVAIALGALGVYDAAGGAVADGAYAALALAVTGAALLLGAVWGRPGGLVLLAVVCALATAAGVVVGSVPDERSTEATPGAASMVRPAYRIGNGRLLLDLSQVSDPRALDGRRIELGARSGLVEVVLPPGLGAHVAARIDLAGVIDVGDVEQGGVAPRVHSYTAAPAGAPVIDLDIDSRLGAITVRSQR